MESSSSTGTKSQEEQWAVQSRCFEFYDFVYSLPPRARSIHFEIRRDSHLEYLTKSLKQLAPNFAVLDANRPWLCYWIIHSIALLGDCIDDRFENHLIDFLNRCQDPNGGYGGGPGQMPHLATTYAAVNSLITVGGHRSLSSINRKQLYSFMLRMKEASGGFRMHDGGEVDVRACYTALSVASILNVLDEKLTQNVGDYIIRCQTYEGGIAGEPGTEAHGGYTFCGLAAMVLINEVHRLDLPRLINWVVYRQGVECGFQGRANKLVDGCYSFWQGGVAAIIQRLHVMVNEQLGIPNTFLHRPSTDSDDDDDDDDDDSTVSDADQCSEGTSSPVNNTCQHTNEGESSIAPPAGTNNLGYMFIKTHKGMKPLFNSVALQQYILLCAQAEAGFRDKPGKARDHYHTCYVLSGLSVCQHINVQEGESPPLPKDVLGPYSNLLEPVHPLHNIVLDKYFQAFNFFAKL